MGKKLDITVLTGVSAGDIFRFDLETGGAVVIGRADGCELVLQDAAVSRQHAKISWTGSGFEISDLGSTHGTVHMGFQLKANEPRPLQSHDEFKIGSAIFRAGFEAVKPKEEKKATGKKEFRLPLKISPLKLGLISALALLLVVLLLFVGPEESSFPAQRSHLVLSMPQEKPLGYLPGANTSYADKVQLLLPTSDQVIEFEYLSEAPIKILIDDSQLEVLDPGSTGWKKHAFLVRDTMSGMERKVIFDSTGFPKPQGSPAKWAVRNIRSTLVSPLMNSTTDSELSGAIAVSENITRSSGAMYSLLRALQRTALALMKEAKLESVDQPIDLENAEVDAMRWKSDLELIRRERTQSAVETAGRHLKVLAGMAGAVDAELWRRVNINLRQAENSAKMKEYIEAHDALLRVKAMFPSEDDFRWMTADRMLNDKNIVPPRILKNPGKYRK